jgi:hypothetical protein
MYIYKRRVPLVIPTILCIPSFSSLGGIAAALVRRTVVDTGGRSQGTS